METFQPDDFDSATPWLDFKRLFRASFPVSGILTQWKERRSYFLLGEVNIEMSSEYSSKTNISEDKSGIENVTFWGKKKILHKS